MKNRTITAGILTFHNYDNYGAILQSYALRKKLEERGVEAEIIDYDCRYISRVFSINSLRKRGLWGFIYTAIGHICYLPRHFLCNKFRKNMKYSSPMTADNAEEMGTRYDCYIAGSDQIWDASLTDFDRTYFLPFVGEGHKKFSYAASIGEHLPPEQYRKEYAELLNGFDHIIVREEYGADVVEELTGKRPDTACDPTLLLTASEWAAMAAKRRTKGRYILVYQLGVNKKLVDFVAKLKKKTGLRVVYIPFPLVGLLPCKLTLTAGPAEWLRLFMDAEYVVSDSFHGVVFALLFNKTFFVYTKGQHVNRRVEEVLDRVGLTDRTIDRISDEDLDRKTDFASANREIQKYRERSLERLEALINETELA